MQIFARCERFLYVTVMLSWADLLAGFRNYFLSSVWAVLQPIGLMLVFTVIKRMVDIRTEGVPYPLFSFTALLVWGFLSAAALQSSRTINVNASIIKSLPLPKSVFPFSTLLTSAINAILCLPIFIFLLVTYKVSLGASLLWLPLLILLTVALGLALAMSLGLVGAIKPDFQMIGQFGMQLWMFSSPVLYSSKSVPQEWRALYDLNPAVGLIEGFRDVLLHNRTPDLHLLLYSVATTLIMLLLSWPFFRSTSRYLAEVL